MIVIQAISYLAFKTKTNKQNKKMTLLMETIELMMSQAALTVIGQLDTTKILRGKFDQKQGMKRLWKDKFVIYKPLQM